MKNSILIEKLSKTYNSYIAKPIACQTKINKPITQIRDGQRVTFSGLYLPDDAGFEHQENFLSPSGRSAKAINKRTE